MNRALPNDSCAETRQAELDFVNRHKLEPYDPSSSSRSAPKLATIVVSRALDTSYVWPERAPLSARDLEWFAETGHTLGFDYESMYVRNFALDLDCVCRVEPRTISHLNEPLVRKIVATVNETLASMLGLSTAKPPNHSIWRRGCGFHVYYDIPVSLETHLRIGRILSAKYSARDVCIEVPKIMPLPFSAKESRSPYQPMMPTQDEYSLTPRYDEAYYNLFEYTQAFGKTVSCAKIVTRTGVFHCNLAAKPRKKFGELSIRYVQSVSILAGHEYMDPLISYINRLAMRDAVTDSSERQATANAADTATEHGRGGGGVTIDDDPELRDRFTTFMLAFNKLFVESETTECDAFVNFASLSHDGLYLQHYAVLLHKHLEPITDERMRELLTGIFSASSSKVIERFIEYYDSRTLNCYTDSADAMMKHLHFLYTRDISPLESLNEQLDKLLRIALCEGSSESFRHSLSQMPNDERRQSIEQAVRAYCEIIIEMRVVMYNVSTSNYYTLSDMGTHYKISAKQENYPTIFNWIGNGKSQRELVCGEMEILRAKYSVSQTLLLSRCPFQISTITGVFNSVIGLYTAKSRFLRFLCYRDTAVWTPSVEKVMYSTQNHDLVKHHEVVLPYVETLFSDISPMFVHFILAPAFIQLRRIHHIEEYQIKSLVRLLTRYKSLPSAYFLVEYYPIDPRFVFVLMYCCQTYDGFDTLERYQTLSDHVFHVFHCDTVTESSWTNKFDPILSEMKYTVGETHMQTLMSITHEAVNGFSEDFCLCMTLLAVCFVKCRSYATFCEAFRVTTLPPPRSEHPEYAKNFNWDTSLSSAGTNLHRAIRIVFPGEHDDFEKNLIMTLFAVCMSTFFDQEIARELIVSISAIFLSNNVLKKCFLMYGPSGTGKSFLSDLLQILTSPKVGRYTSLHEAMDRANVTLKNNVVIINEMKHIDGDKIKAVTGNDAESTKQFYTQEYEMHTNQSLVYGATNSVIDFKGNSYIDQVSVRRFHALKLCGQQMTSDFKSASMFNMMVNSQLYSGTMKPAESQLDNLAIGLSWLCFVSYMRYRDENLYPTINVDAACNREYLEMVYRSNNKLYDFLVNNGIIVASGFHMRSERFVNTVKMAIRSAKNDVNAVSPFSSFHEFKQRFESFGTPLELDGTVHGFQEIGLVHHIRRNMSTSLVPDAVIAQRDITERTLVYTDSVDRENAESYFARENKSHYVHETGVYVGIEFAQLPVSYDHNVLDAAPSVNTASKMQLDTNI